MSSPNTSNGRDSAAAVAYDLSTRAIDHQVRLISAEHQKVESLVRLGMAMIAGKLAVFGLLVNADAPLDGYGPECIRYGCGHGLGGNFGLFWVTVFRGSESGVLAGVDLPVVRHQLVTGPDTRVVFLAAGVSGMTDAYHENEDVLAALGKARAMAGVWLGTGISMHLISISYISRGVILA